jgi:hypothetical protein
MGMSDKQFDAYKKRVLREIERAKDEIDSNGKSPTLEQLIIDLKGELERP